MHGVLLLSVGLRIDPAMRYGHGLNRTPAACGAVWVDRMPEIVQISSKRGTRACCCELWRATASLAGRVCCIGVLFFCTMLFNVS